MARKTRKFKTEVQQLLDLVVHSLYSKKEIFLRELISNASDAIDRLRFESLTDADLMKEDGHRIKLIADKEARTLTIRDDGVGMNAEELDTNIGTIANSGTKAYLEKLKASQSADDAQFIGQFGVGFYASFMVADEVEVITRRAGQDEPAYRWRSKGTGQYTVEETEKDAHGTDIILHLNEDAEEYLDEWRLRSIVRQYSDYITYPVVMDVTRTEGEGDDAKSVTEEETLNSMKAVWKRSKKDVSEEEYKEFYKHVSHDYSDPFETVHFSAEGTTEFQCLVFVPAQAPFDLYMRESFKGLHLYVKNVFITDDCKELIPEYLRFVKGVVDSSDLPLNVSREILQDDAIIRRIRKNVVSKVLGALSDRLAKAPDEYRGFFAQFGRVLKEGLAADHENADKIKNLLLFPSTKSDDSTPTTLKAYVERMPEEQKEIYFLTGESLEAARQSPLLEAFRQKDFEVLFLTDPVDEWVSQHLDAYDGKAFKPIDRGEIDLEGDADSDEKKEQREAASKEYSDLTEYIQKRLDEDIETVRLSSRLTESACCLVTAEGALNTTMERLMRAMNQEVPKSKRILELNPEHPLIQRMNTLQGNAEKQAQLDDYIDLVYGQALILEGSAVKDPGRFAHLVSDLMVATAP